MRPKGFSLMLLAKGWAVALTLESGRKVRGAHGAALLHDESGRDWPKCSGLVMPVRKTKRPLSDSNAKRYFGNEYNVREAVVTLPTQQLSAWDLIGHVTQIDYSRLGQYEDDFYHPFSRTGWIWKSPYPRLYRLDRKLRLDLGSGCVWNWRGIVTP